MTINTLEKARAAAEKAARDLAALESAEAEKAAQRATERDARQRELDINFLTQWKALDDELLKVGSKTAADAVYEGADPIAAVATFWVARAKRNTIRQHARMAYFRVHGEHPVDAFAMELTHRDMMLATRLEEAMSGAASRHAADLSGALEAEWMVSDGT